ncbi:uncharacterized protein LOC123316029 [Coccinella septempunctata]|uniref:uncharacterized protein LOC123316029 n=1 Tax=Coccinella septempunctata TaxID=41139 RepID=UPI001D05EB13|nr:uncharacterized protein LOC123316029 [Coccinella septempunctata]
MKNLNIGQGFLGVIILMGKQQNRNLSLALLLLLFIVHKVRTGAIKAPLSIITLEDISEEERRHLDAVHVQYERSKRSGSSSPDLLGSLKTLLAQGAKAKLRLIGRASAAASSSLASSSSSSSSGKSYPSPSHGYSYHPYPVQEKPDPFWMKKAVLNTLLQAVKAIKGGVLALKGQLIKGGGYLLVGGGKLVKAKGEVITNLGKKIAKSAFRDMHSSEVHEDGSYGHYHPSEIEYEHPGPEPSFPDHFHHADYHGSFPDKAPGVQSGILILKKIPSGKNSHTSHYGAESTINEHKVVEPSFGTIVGKLLSAASSSNPDSPVPFTDYRQTHPQPDHYAGDEHGPSEDASEDQHDQGNFDTDFELEPAFDSPEANKVIQPESSGEVALGPHNVKISEDTHGDASHSPAPPSAQLNLPIAPASNFNGGPQGSNYGTFVNLAQDFGQLNLPTNSDNFQNHFAGIQDQQNFQNNALNPQQNVHLVGGNFAEPPENYAQDQNIPNNVHNSVQQSNSPNIFDHNFAEPPPNLLQYNLEPPQGSIQGVSLSAKFGSFEQLPSRLDKNDFSSNSNFLGPYNPDFLRAQSHKPRRPPPKRSYDKYRGNLKNLPKINQNLVDPSSNLDLPRFLPNHNNSPKINTNHSNFPPFPNKQPRPPTRSHSQYPSSTKHRQVSSQQFTKQSPFTRSQTQPRPPNFDIVQSVTYQLGPNGPTKILTD